MSNEVTSFCPADKQEWRAWLEINHQTVEGVWLIIRKKASGNPNLTWSEAVDEALCFGWIDSLKRPIDSFQYQQYFGKRKASSTWSKINKDKVEVLIAAGAMTEMGYKSIKLAKENGSWTIFDQAERLEIPEDLERAFAPYPDALVYFKGLSKSVKKSALHWIILAKRPETREKRITEIVKKAQKGEKPTPF